VAAAISVQNVFLFSDDEENISCACLVSKANFHYQTLLKMPDLNYLEF